MVHSIIFAIMIIIPNIGFPHGTYDVVITTQNIAKGMKISHDNVEMGQHNNNNKDIATDLSQVMGRTAKRNIQSNKPVYFRNLEYDYSVLKNSVIEVSYQKDGVYLHSRGKALQNGNTGDQIMIEYPNSVIRSVKITGKNTAQII
ncbi:MAG: flagella basal body P-ring formation protein FlgA [Candidatus Xenolissoclinum pacificiensis L6]|uniref:Flagella basal body P-ring formation protein FlgA n=1 Tax=Candidatus Xenolissoclinum pacificiensis L6 TaxID=1401685 RepID=W2V1E9_9RICK|nr:MAG: flagella basal body P-ring formation protein FlgA [Candidatus Xenolissoclinum pacificiensis L6]